MGVLHGPISDRLRKIFAPDDEAWTPQRPASPKRETPKPKGVQGIAMTGRQNKKK